MPQQSIRVNFVTGAARRYLPHVEALAAIPDQLAQALAEGSPSWFASGGSSGWPPARIVGGMISYARATHEHLFRMAWMTDPVLNIHDEDAEAAEEHWEQHNAQALLDRFTEEIAKSVELLDDLPDSSWGRPGIHPDFGRRSIRRQVDIAVADLEDQIERLRRMHMP